MRHTTLMLAVLYLFASTALADELFVPSAEYPTIQAAIDAAVDGDEVVLQDGVFSGEGNENLRMPAVAITVRSASGDPSRTAIRGMAPGTSRAFVFDGTSSQNSTIRGLTISGFNANPGAAIQVIDSAARFENCVLGPNGITREDCSEVLQGGAVHAARSDLEFHDCRFVSNTLSHLCFFGEMEGGAAYLDTVVAVFIRCSFTDNGVSGSDSSYGSGGAIAAIRSQLLILDSEFRDNAVGEGIALGGAIDFSNGALHIIGCEFVGNSAAGSIVGSAEGGAIASRGSMKIWSSQFLRNSVDCYDVVCSIAFGGAIASNGETLLVGVTIIGNSATAELVEPGSTLSGYAGGLHVRGTATLHNCTMSGNSGSQFDNMYVSGALSIFNSILWNGEQTLDASPERTDVLFSNFQDGYPGDGNIDADPLFEPGTYRLLPGSPCIDAGNTNLLPADEFDLDGDGDTTEPLPLDAAGLARFVDDPATPDTGVGFPVVDMGAFEYQPPCRVDMDGDGVLTIFDFLAFFNAFDDGDPVADFDGDGAFTVYDFMAFQNEFDAGCG